MQNASAFTANRITQSQGSIWERTAPDNQDGTGTVFKSIAGVHNDQCREQEMVYRTAKKQAWLLQMSRQLSVLSNVSRVQIIMLLCDGELSVGALAARVGLSQSALSQHLLKLKEVGAVNVRREAQRRFYSINADFLNRFRDNLRFFVLAAQPKKRTPD